MKLFSTCFSVVIFFILSFSNSVNADTGLVIEKPATVSIIYTIEPNDVTAKEIQSIVENLACHAGITPGSRNDAQLFVRVEKHAGHYLLYLDFNRDLFFTVEGKQYSTKGFVWGRYANNIDSYNELLEDLEFFVEEFFAKYKHANNL